MPPGQYLEAVAQVRAKTTLPAGEDAATAARTIRGAAHRPLATVTGDMQMPSTAVHVQRKLGAHRAAAFDVSAACAASGK